MVTRLVRNRRELTQRAISLNPITIQLTRKTREPYGGGWREQEQILPPQTFRLFISSSRGSREVAGVGGQMQFDQVSLLAPHDADIRKGDTFTLDLDHTGRFMVEQVQPVRLLGEVVSLQVSVVEVS